MPLFMLTWALSLTSPQTQRRGFLNKSSGARGNFLARRYFTVFIHLPQAFLGQHLKASVKGCIGFPYSDLLCVGGSGGLCGGGVGGDETGVLAQLAERLAGK